MATLPAAGLFAPPWGSKARVNRAGDRFRSHSATEEDIEIFELWRGSHRYILNTFKPLLWSRTRGKNITTAQRLKRRATIIDKLSREPKMQLARMDDIAGCHLYLIPSMNWLNLEKILTRVSFVTNEDMDVIQIDIII
jgi:hypothetical protein